MHQFDLQFELAAKTSVTKDIASFAKLHQTLCLKSIFFHPGRSE